MFGRFKEDLIDPELYLNLSIYHHNERQGELVIVDKFCNHIDPVQHGKSQCPPVQGDAFMQSKFAFAGGYFPSVSFLIRGVILTNSN